jgi:hypothetical protein
LVLDILLAIHVQDRTMMEESDRAWDKISARSYAFNALRDECAHLRALTLDQVGWLRLLDGQVRFCHKTHSGARCWLVC